jgi:hypothetical protein
MGENIQAEIRNIVTVKALAMKRFTFLILTLAILSCLLTAGCTTSPEPAATPAATPVPTVLQTTVPVTTLITTAPTTEPVQSLPPERQVNLVLTKDRPTSEIHLLYQGGPGQIYVTKILMRVYSPDGTYKDYVMSNAQKPIPGDEIVAPGTRNPDRCEVFIISSGTRYKVIDEPAIGGGYY